MTDEERERQMDFILAQQAQFAANLQELRETQAQAERRWARTEEGIYALLTIAEIHEREITALREHSSETDARMRQTDERMRETAERMKETDERINALVNTVERIISERRNGKG